MEAWIPLFQIFLNSPSPETEASLWLQKTFNPSSSNTTPISTTSFLSLLANPSHTTSTDPSSPQHKRVMWIETLPDLVQARILSFLAYDYKRFCRRDLCKLARTLLGEGKCLDFWVKRAAQQLFDLVSVSNYQWISHLNLDSEEENVEDEFYSMPDWLRDAAKDNKLMFSWLPISPDELSAKMSMNVSIGNEDDLSSDMEECTQDELDDVMREIDVDVLKLDDTMDTEVEEMAKSLKSRLLSIESTAMAVELAKEIRELCFQSRTKSLVILSLIEPWSIDDEIAAVLISHLSDKCEADELGWPAHVLSSVILPKFLIINEPSSRVLLAATIDYCKAHQRAAEYALLFPLIMRNEGINNPICEVITRIVRDCMHPAHVSAFIQKLLCKDKMRGNSCAFPATGV